MNQQDDRYLREELLELLRMSAETVGLLKPSLEIGGQPGPSEERILAYLEQLEKEGLVRSFMQDVSEVEATRPARRETDTVQKRLF